MIFNNGELVRVLKEEEVGGYVDSSIRRLLGKEMFVRIASDRHCTLEYPSGEVVINEYGGDLQVENKYIGKNATPSFVQLKEGMKVTVLKNLKEYTEYGGLNTGSHGMKLKGQVCTVSKIDTDNTFKLEEDTTDSWFSRGMLEEYTKIDETQLNEGDSIMIIPNLRDKDVYDSVDVNESGMYPLSGKLATITRVYDNGGRIRLDIDRGRFVWTPSMLRKLKEGAWLFSIEEAILKNIAIKCEDKESVITLFNTLKELGIKTGSGKELDGEDFSSNHDIEDYFFEVTKEEKLLYCEESYFVDQEYKIFNFKDIVFDCFTIVKKIPFNVETSKTMTYEELENREMHLGDIYYVNGFEDERHNGWRIAMNGYSIGLNTKDKKSWTSVKEDVEMGISKIIPYEKPVHLYCNMSEFMRTGNEELVGDMIIRVLKDVA